MQTPTIILYFDIRADDTPESIAYSSKDEPLEYTWLPKGLIEENQNQEGIWEVILPKWLAIKKGLVAKSD